jgi:ABC-2 type transport system ATP-binding protein
MLNIRNIKKVYSNNKVAIEDMNLEVQKGDFLALLGPNGAGKSTLINIIASVIKKTSGSITCNGYDHEKDATLFKQQVGIVPQELNFDPFFNAMEILTFQQGMYGLKKNVDSIMELLENLGLKEHAFKSTRSLSGGMRRRLLIAKAMIHNPDLLILDEPTAGVDVELRHLLWNFLQVLNKNGKTIILTTHYLEEAEFLCDKIAIINKGKLIVNDSKINLMDKIGKQVLNVATKTPVEHNFQILGFNCEVKDSNNIAIAFSKEEEMGLILENLFKQNVGIQSFNVAKSSLEDVFLNITNG